LKQFQKRENPEEVKAYRSSTRVANGAVDASQPCIAPVYSTKGDMKMYASKPPFSLKVSPKLDLKKIKNYNTWLVYEQSGDEKDVYLDLTSNNGRGSEKRKLDCIMRATIVFTSHLFLKKNHLRMRIFSCQAVALFF